MKNEIMANKEVRMTSVELVDMINQFRKMEGNRSELLHKNLISKISKEIETLDSLGFRGQLNFKPSSYVNSQNKEQPCYELNRDGVLQLCMSESTIVRYKVLEYVNKLESKVTQLQSKANLLLSIYNGGQDGILASKQLTEIEVAEATKPLLETIEVKEKIIEVKEHTIGHQKDVIGGLTDEVDIYTKRNIVNRIIKMNGSKSGSYSGRYTEMYKCFKETYGIDLKVRCDNYNLKQIKKKDQLSVIKYAEMFEYMDKLYQVACKLYEADVKKILIELGKNANLM